MKGHETADSLCRVGTGAEKQQTLGLALMGIIENFPRNDRFVKVEACVLEVMMNISCALLRLVPVNIQHGSKFRIHEVKNKLMSESTPLFQQI